MAAAVLIVLVAVDTALTGWCLAHYLYLRHTVELVTEITQGLDHDMSVISGLVGDDGE